MYLITIIRGKRYEEFQFIYEGEEKEIERITREVWIKKEFKYNGVATTTNKLLTNKEYETLKNKLNNFKEIMEVK